MRYWKCDHCGETLDREKDYRFTADGIHEDVEVFGKYEDLCDGCLKEFQALRAQVYRGGLEQWKR